MDILPDRRHKSLMIKEIITVFLLVLMLAAAFLNIQYLKVLIEDITELISESKNAAVAGDWGKAATTAKHAEKLWDDKTGYTHVILRHGEIDTVSDALYDYISCINEQDVKASGAAADKVKYHLDSIYKMEQVRFGSIF